MWTRTIESQCHRSMTEKFKTLNRTLKGPTAKLQQNKNPASRIAKVAPNAPTPRRAIIVFSARQHADFMQEIQYSPMDSLEDVAPNTPCPSHMKRSSFRMDSLPPAPLSPSLPATVPNITLNLEDMSPEEQKLVYESM